jgi:hypothetical protein
MYRLAYGIFGAVLVVLMVTPAMATHVALNGNGLPHINYSEKYNLELHAYKTCPPSAFDGSNRHVIALLADFGDFNGAANRHPDLLRINDILLMSDTDFKVVDGNACDANPAVFTLPANVSTAWEVYFRLVGQPGTGLDIATCGTDATNTIICGGPLVRVRQASKPHFEDVTKELLTVNGIPLFTSLTGEFWEVFTQGQAKAQLIFVPVPAP